VASIVLRSTGHILVSQNLPLFFISCHSKSFPLSHHPRSRTRFSSQQLTSHQSMNPWRFRENAEVYLGLLDRFIEDDGSSSSGIEARRKDQRAQQLTYAKILRRSSSGSLSSLLFRYCRYRRVAGSSGGCCTRVLAFGFLTFLPVRIPIASAGGIHLARLGCNGLSCCSVRGAMVVRSERVLLEKR
jgi:hypothetical protein